jgi:hypothetical protein
VTGSKRAQRIVILPIEIAGVAAGLQQGLSLLGREVDLLLRRPSGFQYPVTPPRPRVSRMLWQWILLNPQQEQRRSRRLLSLLARMLVLPVLCRYDAAVYIGSDTLLRDGLDRQLLRLAGVRVVTVFCGSDARPPYLSGRWVDPSDGILDLPGLHAAVQRTHATVARAERQSDLVVNHPATAQFHRRTYVDWTTLGMPQPRPADPPDRSRSADTVRVMHAPSVMRWKGTDQVRTAVAALQDEGLAIDYVEIVDRPNSEVLSELVATDVVVDELYSDALLAGLAAEAARAGCAVLVAGLAGPLVAELARRVGAPHDHFIHPDRLLERLRELVVDEPTRTDLGTRLQAFVSTTWDQAEIAQRYAVLLDGQPPEHWMDEPDAAPYLGGWGAPQERVTAALQAYVDRYGVAALKLADPAAATTMLSL